MLEEENRFFALCQAGLDPLNLFMKNQKIPGFRDTQRQKYSVMIKSPKPPYCPQPPANLSFLALNS